MNILILNAGSSSIKYKLFHHSSSHLETVLSGLIEGIGESSSHWHHQYIEPSQESLTLKSHQEAFTVLAHRLNQQLSEMTINAVGHRVVHGGEALFEPTVITPKILQTIQDLTHLAPIHNPANLMGIEFAQKFFPEALHVAMFDSGFHHSIPQVAHTYAIEQETAVRYQIRRYGFHGINHEYVAEVAAKALNKPLSSCHFITLHLGNGASACLIQQGQSYDTTMGLTPLAGLIMGSRCGDIDPAIALYLQRAGLSLQEVDELLNQRSGLMGIAKDNDMRRLLSRQQEGDTQADLAISMYVYAIQKCIGAYLSQIPQLDGLIFTGGVGENAALIRDKIISGLSHFGFSLASSKNEARSSEACRLISEEGIPIFIVRGNEEQFIAEKVVRLMSSPPLSA